tara:strand:+ start:1797 stop:3326 length:1530 start_codon:yes stop_codon:yes gene_type:complete
MTGGFLQLVSYGSQDFYLTGNPQISFFKTVYRRYTNFSMDFYRINPENNLGLAETATTTYKFKIERNGDLISQIFLVFTLPNIYSDNGSRFRWVENIGSSAVERISVYLGGNLIDQHYGEWFDIWQELTVPLSKKTMYNELIGNVPELYNPELSPKFTSYPNKSKSANIPSIVSRTIRLPLIFWFNRNPSLALPLVALQYYPVEIQVEFKAINDLFTIRDIFTSGSRFGSQTKNNRNSYHLRIKPIQNNTDYTSTSGLQNFVKDSVLTVNDNNEIVNFFIDPYLDVNYIFLDNEEMNKFAKSEHKYLIEQVSKTSFKNILGNATLDLKLHHPTSFIVVVPKRTDAENRNDWSNYTNWITTGIPWNSFNEFFEPYYDDDQAKEVIGDSNYSIKGNENIIKNLSLTLNGVERFTSKDPDFYNFAQPFCYGEASPKRGIMLYSFSLEPFSYQPSGSCNMSRFNDIKLVLETVGAPIPSGKTDYLYKFNVDVYAVNYNVLRITGGMGNLEFTN